MLETDRGRPPSPARRLLVRGALAIGAGAALAGCGQKGPLYFPEERVEEEKEKRKSSSTGRPERPYA